MHYCHINSSSGRHIDRVLGAGGAVSGGGQPRHHRGLSRTGRDPPRSVPRSWPPNGSANDFRGTERDHLPPDRRTHCRRRSAARAARRPIPAGLVIAEFLDETDPRDVALLRHALTFPSTRSSRATRCRRIWTGNRRVQTSPSGHCHPRPSPTHERRAPSRRALRLWRDEGTPLIEAIGRATLASRVGARGGGAGNAQEGAGATRRRRRPRRVRRRANHRPSDVRRATTVPSAGISHVIVDGTFVVRGGQLVPDALPGRPIRAEPT